MDIPKNANDELNNYFTKKINIHTSLYLTKREQKRTIEKLNQEASQNQTTLKIQNEKIKNLDEKLRKTSSELKNKIELENQLKIYKERYGDSFTFSDHSKKESFIVYWQIENNIIKLHSKEKEFEKYLPKKIALLLKSQGRPQVGNFELAILVNRVKIKDTYGLKIDTTNITSGSYFIKPIVLANKTKNIHFFHHQQSLSSEDFDWNQTKINI
ncbi:hypothetical protein H2O64_15030 [Kordia sp. YSTF-M3]|uniref:Uncharacterized protein n=1 Tax=Kordia aestuariivivens TaxID=2759037 RepID=A0ABR7QBQ5_9FLAO|nr:hypothetical protein [Kordia aestuariivivens]MBC8755990.1 hypothetical protein [Kordia aestuariivivens]